MSPKFKYTPLSCPFSFFKNTIQTYELQDHTNFMYLTSQVGILVLWKSLYEQYIDAIKQATVADTVIHKAFN